MIRIIIGVCVVALLIIACYLLNYGRRFLTHATWTQAKVIDTIYSGREGQRNPIVEFLDSQGVKRCCRAQNVGANGVKSGQKVQILYTRKSFLGMTLWNVYVLDRNGKAALWIYSLGGVIALCVAALLVMVFVRFQ